MTEQANTQTWIRRNAAGVYRWALGELAHRMTSTVAGLLPDSVAHALWSIRRWGVPADDTPVDAIPILLRRFGAPSYDGETYVAALLRLRTLRAVQEIGGSVSQLIAEWLLVTDRTVTIREYESDRSFEVVDTGGGLDPVPTYGDFVYGDGTTWGGLYSGRPARRVRELLRYYRPARSRYRGIVES